MWDSMALWYMLDNASDRNQSAMAYNYQNNRDFQQWRREADRLSESNTDLKIKLALLDQQVKSMDGQPIDDTYAPNGMDKDLMLSSVVLNNIKPKLKICSGMVGGSYNVYANKMKLALGAFDVSVIITKGSTDNITKLESNICDVALTQRDAYDLYSICSNAVEADVISLCESSGIMFKRGSGMDFTRISSPFGETVVGVCNGGIDTILDSSTVSLLNGSGSVVTWNNLVMESDKMDGITVKLYQSLKEVFKSVSSGKSDCAVISANSRSKIFKDFDKLLNDDMYIIPLDYKSVSNILDPVGKPVYIQFNVPVERFNKGASKHSGWFDKTIPTFAIPTDVIISNNYDQHLSTKIKTLTSGIEL